MGLVKIYGHSTNDISHKPSIMDGDFVSLLFTPDTNNNDIALASFDDQQTSQSFLTVKRYRNWEQSLNSETAETGTEYKKIVLKELDSAKIIGIVYAVTKPI